MLPLLSLQPRSARLEFGAALPSSVFAEARQSDHSQTAADAGSCVNEPRSSPRPASTGQWCRLFRESSSKCEGRIQKAGTSSVFQRRKCRSSHSAWLFFWALRLLARRLCRKLAIRQVRARLVSISEQSFDGIGRVACGLSRRWRVPVLLWWVPFRPTRARTTRTASVRRLL